LELLDAAAAARFDAVNMWLVPPQGPALFAVPPGLAAPVIGDARAVREIKLRVASTGIYVGSASCGWLGPDFARDHLRRACETLAEIGARAAAVVGWDADRARLVDHLAALCAAAADYGLRVTLEFMPYSAVRSIRDAAAVLAAAAQPNLDVMVDALHLARSGGSPDDIDAVAPERITLFQICDAPRAGPPPARLRDESVNRRRYPGEGDLPLRAMLAALPTGVAVEVEVPTAAHAGLPIIERARRCAETTRRFLASG
jgi:sugar phosphate isomerase/epimerase